MAPTSRQALLIFARNPVQGQVKTRLARQVGEAEALRIYRYLLHRTRQVAQSIPADRFLFYDQFISEKDEWPESFFQKKLQTDGDLGQRMRAAFATIFEHDYAKAVIIGSDCPELSAQVIFEAFDHLMEKDMVIGPSKDGGYYLLGMKRLHNFLFENMPWSTSRLLLQTKAAIDARQHTCALLPLLRDVDDANDWRAYQQQQTTGRL